MAKNLSIVLKHPNSMLHILLLSIVLFQAALIVMGLPMLVYIVLPPNLRVSAIFYTLFCSSVMCLVVVTSFNGQLQALLRDILEDRTQV